MGGELQRRLTDELSSYEMVKAVRGMGLLLGIEFAVPRRLSLRVPFEAFLEDPSRYVRSDLGYAAVS